MSNEQILDSLPTLDIVRALSKRQGVVSNTSESKTMQAAVLIILGQEDQDGIMRLCSKRWVELNQEDVVCCL